MAAVAQEQNPAAESTLPTVNVVDTALEANPNAEPGVKPMMSSSKMYVCIKCHANFKTGDGKPDPRLRGLGRCNNCLNTAAAVANGSAPASAA